MTEQAKYVLGGLVVGFGLYAAVQQLNKITHKKPEEPAPNNQNINNNNHHSVSSPRRKSLSQDEIVVEREKRKGDKPVVVWVDGVFDMMHFGHANMLRQAKALGDKLIVGVNSDASVLKEKGFAPVMKEEERLIAVKGCKWCDEVVPSEN